MTWFYVKGPCFLAWWLEITPWNPPNGRKGWIPEYWLPHTMALSNWVNKYKKTFNDFHLVTIYFISYWTHIKKYYLLLWEQFNFDYLIAIFCAGFILEFYQHGTLLQGERHLKGAWTPTFNSFPAWDFEALFQVVLAVLNSNQIFLSPIRPPIRAALSWPHHSWKNVLNKATARGCRGPYVLQSQSEAVLPVLVSRQWLQPVD